MAMSVPGPPPPPPPGPPPPSFAPKFNQKPKSSVDDRSALLTSIRQGTKLKKAVTNDKSGPYIPGKVSSNDDGGRSTAPKGGYSQTGANGLALGSLFAQGMPKLRPTGKNIGAGSQSLQAAPPVPRTSPTVQRTSPTTALRTSPDSPRLNKLNGQLNDVLRKQMASDIKNRGPPPQPPANRNISTQDTVDTPTLNQNRINPSFLHNLNNNNPIKAPANHGKPNLAPKPPSFAPQPSSGAPSTPRSPVVLPGGALPYKPATPPKKLVVNGKAPVARAQSMRVPRSPPVAPPSNPPFPPVINGKDFSSMRGIPTAFHQSQENLKTHTRNQTLPVNLGKPSAPPPPNSRPTAPPPGRPTVPPPPARTGSNVNLKAPLSPPPPPPNVQQMMPPMLPPHRTQVPPPPAPPHTRMPPAVPPSNGPPPPPVRNSSMRNGAQSQDLDSRFSNLFHPVYDFPAPPRYQGLHKVYSSRSALNNKQQAPPPPSIQLGTRLWETSNC